MMICDNLDCCRDAIVHLCSKHLNGFLEVERNKTRADTIDKIEQIFKDVNIFTLSKCHGGYQYSLKSLEIFNKRFLEFLDKLRGKKK